MLKCPSHEFKGTVNSMDILHYWVPHGEAMAQENKPEETQG